MMRKVEILKTPPLDFLQRFINTIQEEEKFQTIQGPNGAGGRVTTYAYDSLGRQSKVTGSLWSLHTVLL